MSRIQILMIISGHKLAPNFSVEPTGATKGVSTVLAELDRFRLRRGVQPSACGSPPGSA
jgi:hypothetical protein